MKHTVQLLIRTKLIALDEIYSKRWKDVIDQSEYGYRVWGGKRYRLAMYAGGRNWYRDKDPE